MTFDPKRIVLGAAALAGLPATAWADDCAQPRAAMMASAKTPYSETIVSAGANGKPVTSHMVQTANVKYVERNGGWTSLPISSADLVDTLNGTFKNAKMTCKRTGTEQVNGQTAAVYTVRIENAGAVTDGTMWISAQNRMLKSDTTVNGRHSSAIFDYDRVQPPSGAKPVGQR